MRALKQLILTIAIIFVMVGCSDDIIEPRIAKADELLDDYPDSAMTCLKSLSSKDIVTGRDKALYSVVSTMANLKLGNDTVEDRILSDACEYYADEDEPSRGKMLTHFAKAALLSAKDDDINALTEYEKAIRYSSGKNADRYRALSYFNMSSIYTRAYSYPDVKECIEEGMKYMLMSNDTSTMIHGYLVAGMSYNNDGNHAKALELLEKGVGLALKKQDNEMANRLRLQIAYTQSMLNNHREASEIFDSLLHNSDCSLSPADFYTYVNSLSFSGKTEKAENILNSLDSSFIVESRPHWVFSQSIIASEQGNFKEAYKLLSGTMDYQNTVVNDKLNTSFVREQKKLAIANEKMQMQIAENRKKMLTLICCISALTVVSAIILIIYK